MPFRIAHFCKANGEVTRYSQGREEHLIICSEHGTVKPVPYYTIYNNNHVARDPVWTCLQCFEKWINNGPVLVAVDKESCARCQSDKFVKACDICGLPVCSSHRVEGVCDECYESVGGAYGRSWSGL